MRWQAPSHSFQPESIRWKITQQSHIQTTSPWHAPKSTQKFRFISVYWHSNTAEQYARKNILIESCCCDLSLFTLLLAYKNKQTHTHTTGVQLEPFKTMSTHSWAISHYQFLTGQNKQHLIYVASWADVVYSAVRFSSESANAPFLPMYGRHLSCGWNAKRQTHW